MNRDLRTFFVDGVVCPIVTDGGRHRYVLEGCTRAGGTWIGPEDEEADALPTGRALPAVAATVGAVRGAGRLEINPTLDRWRPIAYKLFGVLHLRCYQAPEGAADA
jgi:hypothetical protein